MKALIYQQDYLMCPHGDHSTEMRVDHLYTDRMPVSFGPWYCKSCRGGFSGTVRAKGDVDLTKYAHGERWSRSMALLRFDGKDGPVFFVMDHDRYQSRHDDNSDEANQSHQQYFFEEHSCPTNWLRECILVVKGGDTDPHGFLSFVRAADVPNDFDEDSADWQTLFPEMFNEG